MSSTYSVDSANAYKLGTDSFISNGAPLWLAKRWLAEVPSRSGNASVATSPSPAGSTTDLDLDLESLFKRLDKYTAEMEEVEARLKRNRGASDDSAHLNIQRFSFEIDQFFSDDLVLSAPGGTPALGSSRPTSVQQSSVEVSRTADDAQGNGEILGDQMEDDEEPFLIFQSNVHSYHETPVHFPIQDQGSAESEGAVVSSRASLESGPEMHIPIQNNNGELAEPLPKEPTSTSVNKLLFAKPDSSSSANTNQWLTAPDPEAGAIDQEQDQSNVQELQTQGQDYHFDELEYSDIDEPCPVTPVGWTLPPRSSSKTFSIGDKTERIAESPLKPLQRRITADNRQSVRHGGFWSAPPLLLLEQESSLHGPSLSQSGSEVAIDPSPPLTPLSLCSPREDQIRREMESFALHDGAETLELKYKKRRPPKLDLVGNDEDLLEIEEEEEGQAASETGKQEHSIYEASRTRPRRSKSIRSIFQRRSPIEKVIDLYFDDEPEEKPARQPSKWTTISRRGSPTTAKMPQSPRVPPLPASSPGFGQTSFG